MLPGLSLADTDTESADSDLDIEVENINPENSDTEVSIDDEENLFEDADLSEEDVEAEEAFFSFLDNPQQTISSGVEALAKSLDEFFSDDKVYYDASGTYLRLQGDMVFDDNGEVSYTGDIRLKLRLPHTKDKIKLTFESDADERRDDESVKANTTPVSAANENQYFTGIQATLGDKRGWQFKPSIGLRLSSGVEPYLRLRFKRRFEFEKWSIHWHETPYWFDSTGTGFDSYLEFNRKITSNDLFRAGSYARWTSQNDYFELSQTFTMFHTLSKKRALSYYVGVFGRDEPTVFATHYLVGATYRQNIHKDFLFLEIIPQIKYEKINNFEPEHSLILRLEMIFKK